MNIGIVSHWFNRGQGTVGRHLRSLFDDLGHRTFVLARPTKDHFVRPRFVDGSDVWNQPDVTCGSEFILTIDEFMSWSSVHAIDIAFFDQNYQFESIAALRESGVRTVGRFVWESFGQEHVAGARRAFDVVYSLTRCEQTRYADMGIDSPLLRWGCHPELFEVRIAPPNDRIAFFYPGGYMSKRKPTEAVIRAFLQADIAQSQLIIKTQDPAHDSLVRKAANNDPRIILCNEDLPLRKYYELFASSHVCLAPSRWEGLGLHLYEATAFGMPIITNNNPPMNEMVGDDVNGALVRSHSIGKTPSGIDSFEPDVEGLAAAIVRAGDPSTLRSWKQCAIARRGQCSWSLTAIDFRHLIQQLSGRPTGAAW
jgi:glycosyltransferase involved in cell wall biosynthesis